MYVYKIIDTAEPRTALGYAATSEEAIVLAKKAADHYAGLEFSGTIEIHQLPTNELYLGGIYWETLMESVPFTASPPSNTE